MPPGYFSSKFDLFYPLISIIERRPYGTDSHLHHLAACDTAPHISCIITQLAVLPVAVFSHLFASYVKEVHHA